MAKKSKQTPPTAAKSGADLAASTMIEALEAMRFEIQRLSTPAAHAKGRDPVVRIASLSKQVAAIGAELRKAESGKRKQLDSLTTSDVVAWARHLKLTERAHLVQQLVAIDDAGSVLG